MPILYWAIAPGAEEAIKLKLENLRRPYRLADYGTGLHIILLQDPPAELIDWTLSLISADLLRSAALVVNPLDNNSIWIAVEWWHGLLVEAVLLESTGLGNTYEFERTDAGNRIFAIIRIPRKEPRTVEPEGPEPNVLGLGKVLDQSTVLADPVRYFGDYTDPFVGGANALFAAGQEAARQRGLPTSVVVYDSPEKFGFLRDTSEQSVNAWRRRHVIEVVAVGFGLDDWSQAHKLGERHNHEAAMREFEEQAQAWRDQGLRFGVAAMLIGLDDPPVVIPMGSVFQQPKMGTQMQNLASAQSITAMVPAGAVVPIVLPAYCLNQSFSPPRGPVAPTSFVFAGAYGSQSDVWSEIASRYSVQS